MYIYIYIYTYIYIGIYENYNRNEKCDVGIRIENVLK